MEKTNNRKVKQKLYQRKYYEQVPYYENNKDALLDYQKKYQQSINTTIKKTYQKNYYIKKRKIEPQKEVKEPEPKFICKIITSEEMPLIVEF